MLRLSNQPLVVGVFAARAKEHMPRTVHRPRPAFLILRKFGMFPVRMKVLEIGNGVCRLVYRLGCASRLGKTLCICPSRSVNVFSGAHLAQRFFPGDNRPNFRMGNGLDRLTSPRYHPVSMEFVKHTGLNLHTNHASLVSGEQTDAIVALAWSKEKLHHLRFDQCRGSRGQSKWSFHRV